MLNTFLWWTLWRLESFKYYRSITKKESSLRYFSNFSIENLNMSLYVYKTLSFLFCISISPRNPKKLHVCTRLFSDYEESYSFANLERSKYWPSIRLLISSLISNCSSIDITFLSFVKLFIIYFGKMKQPKVYASLVMKSFFSIWDFPRMILTRSGLNLVFVNSRIRCGNSKYLCCEYFCYYWNFSCINASNYDE